MKIARLERKVSKWARQQRRAGGKCEYCGVRVTHAKRDRPKPTSATMDHVMPLSKGGHTRKNNMVLCCYACNQAKGNLLP